jgi:hypothetical protein
MRVGVDMFAGVKQAQKAAQFLFSRLSVSLHGRGCNATFSGRRIGAEAVPNLK